MDPQLEVHFCYSAFQRYYLIAEVIEASKGVTFER